MQKIRLGHCTELLERSSRSPALAYIRLVQEIQLDAVISSCTQGAGHDQCSWSEIKCIMMEKAAAEVISAVVENVLLLSRGVQKHHREHRQTLVRLVEAARW